MADFSQRIVRIDDASDERVADFCDIRERDLVGRQGRFVAEGTVVLRMLARSSRFDAEKILVLENRVHGIADLLAQFDDAVPILTCNRSVMDAIAGFPMHRGVLAMGRAQAPLELPQALVPLQKRALVLVGSAISNHDNLGSLFRNAAAFGADLVCLDEQSCDPLYRKSIRVSVGTALTLPYTRHGNISDIVDQLGKAGFDLLALSPRGEAPIHIHSPAPRTALLVGTEGEGLPAALLGRLNTARISQVCGVDSLNVAMAAGIALHAIATAQGRI